MSGRKVPVEIACCVLWLTFDISRDISSRVPNFGWRFNCLIVLTLDWKAKWPRVLSDLGVKKAQDFFYTELLHM